MLTVAIDPGVSGAIAILGARGEYEGVADLPIIRDGRLTLVDGGRFQSMLIDGMRGRLARVVVERVGAMPKQGVASAFNFGVGFGSVLSIVQARHLPLEFVAPALWKRQLGLGADKSAALDKARLLFPMAELGLAKHDGRAEALLLAYWAVTRWAPPSATRAEPGADVESAA